MLSQRLKVEPGARPGRTDSTPQAGPPRMRALALGGRVGIESRPRNKYSLGTRARAFSGLLPHSWPCGSSRTLRSELQPRHRVFDDCLMGTQGFLPACPALAWAPGMLQPTDHQAPALDHLLFSDGETEAVPQEGTRVRRRVLHIPF